MSAARGVDDLNRFAPLYKRRKRRSGLRHRAIDAGGSVNLTAQVQRIRCARADDACGLMQAIVGCLTSNRRAQIEIRELYVYGARVPRDGRDTVARHQTPKDRRLTLAPSPLQKRSERGRRNGTAGLTGRRSVRFPQVVHSCRRRAQNSRSTVPWRTLRFQRTATVTLVILSSSAPAQCVVTIVISTRLGQAYSSSLSRHPESCGWRDRSA